MYPHTKLVGKKGPNIVISFLLHFIYSIIPNGTKIYTFSDPCTAQNRNNMLVKYFSYLTHQGRFKIPKQSQTKSQNRNNTLVKYFNYLTHQGRFDFFRHVYPTKEHSYITYDRGFAQIELIIRKQYVVYKYLKIL